MKALFMFFLIAAMDPVSAQQQVQSRVIAPKYNDVMTPVVLRDLPGLKEVLALGKWPDKPDSQGRTPLLVALELKENQLAEALLQAGADPERTKIAARGLQDRELLDLVENVTGQASVGATRK